MDNPSLIYVLTLSLIIGMGSGLGLAISYSIIHRHGGVISVDSKQGKGSMIVSGGNLTGPVMANYLDCGFFGMTTKPYSLDE